MSDWWDQPGRCTLRASHRGAAAGRVIRTSLNAMPCIVWLILLVIIGDMRAMTPFRLSLYKWTRETQPKDNDYICITGFLAYYDFPLTQRVRCLENQKLWKMHHHTCTWRNPNRWCQVWVLFHAQPLLPPHFTEYIFHVFKVDVYIYVISSSLSFSRQMHASSQSMNQTCDLCLCCSPAWALTHAIN